MLSAMLVYAYTQLMRMDGLELTLDDGTRLKFRYPEMEDLASSDERRVFNIQLNEVLYSVNGDTRRTHIKEWVRGLPVDEADQIVGRAINCIAVRCMEQNTHK